MDAVDILQPIRRIGAHNAVIISAMRGRVAHQLQGGAIIWVLARVGGDNAQFRIHAQTLHGISGRVLRPIHAQIGRLVQRQHLIIVRSGQDLQVILPMQSLRVPAQYRVLAEARR